MGQWIWFAVAVLMLVDAVGYTVGAIGPIRRALRPTEPYRQRRLLLNLMLVTVPLITPRDTAHVIPRGLASVLIAIGFAVTATPGSA